MRKEIGGYTGAAALLTTGGALAVDVAALRSGSDQASGRRA